MKKRHQPTLLEWFLKLDPGWKVVISIGVIVFLIWLSAHPDLIWGIIEAMKLWNTINGAPGCGC